MNAIEPKSSRGFTQRIVEELGVTIVGGGLEDQASLPIEAELANNFNASRTIVREAIKMLTAKGLVGSRPRRGTYAEPQSNWNMLDPDVLRWTLQRSFSFGLMREFLTVRLGFEPMAAREAARRGVPEEIREIEAQLNAMRDASPDKEAVRAADIGFHIAILNASGNRFVRQFAPVVRTALTFSIPLTDKAKGVKHANVEDHARIFDAISSGNADLASELITTHLDVAIALIDSLEKAERKK